MKDFSFKTQVEYLGRSRKLSKGTKWSARLLLKCKQDSLFVECSKLILQALMMEAAATREYQPEKAVMLCNLARKRVADCMLKPNKAVDYFCLKNCDFSMRLRR